MKKQTAIEDTYSNPYNYIMSLNPFAETFDNMRSNEEKIIQKELEILVGNTDQYFIKIALRDEKHRRLGVLRDNDYSELLNEAIKIEEQRAITMIPKTAYQPQNPIDTKLTQRPLWHIAYAGLFTMLAFIKELKLGVLSDICETVLNTESMLWGCYHVWNDLKEIWDSFWNKFRTGIIDIHNEGDEQVKIKKYLGEKLLFLFGKELRESEIMFKSVEELCQMIKTQYINCNETNQSCKVNLWDSIWSNKNAFMGELNFEALKTKMKQKDFKKKSLCLNIKNIYENYICTKYLKNFEQTEEHIHEIDDSQFILMSRIADLIYNEREIIKAHVKWEIQEFTKSIFDNTCISAKDYDPSFSSASKASVFFRDITEVIMKINNGLMTCILPVRNSVRDFKNFMNSDFLKEASLKERALYAWDKFDKKDIAKSFQNFFTYTKNYYLPNIMDEDKGRAEDIDAREKSMKSAGLLKRQNTNESIREYRNADGTIEIKKESGDQAAFDTKNRIFDESLEAFKQQPNQKTFDAVIDKVYSFTDEQKKSFKEKYQEILKKSWGYKHIQLKEDFLNNFDPDKDPKLRAALEDGVFQITGKSKIGQLHSSGFDADSNDTSNAQFDVIKAADKSSNDNITKEIDKMTDRAIETVKEEFKSQVDKCKKNKAKCLKKAAVHEFAFITNPSATIMKFAFWIGKKVAFEVVKVPLETMKDHLIFQNKYADEHPQMAKLLDGIVHGLIENNGKIDKDLKDKVKEQLENNGLLHKFYRFKSITSKFSKRKYKKAIKKAHNKDLTPEEENYYNNMVLKYLVKQSTILVEKTTEVISFKLAVSETNSNYLLGLNNLFSIVKPLLLDKICSAVMNYLKANLSANYESLVKRIKLAVSVGSALTDLYNFFRDVIYVDDKTLNFEEFKNKYIQGGRALGKLLSLFWNETDNFCGEASNLLSKLFKKK